MGDEARWVNKFLNRYLVFFCFETEKLLRISKQFLGFFSTKCFVQELESMGLASSSWPISRQRGKRDLIPQGFWLSPSPFLFSFFSAFLIPETNGRHNPAGLSAILSPFSWYSFSPSAKALSFPPVSAMAIICSTPTCHRCRMCGCFLWNMFAAYLYSHT